MKKITLIALMLFTALGYAQVGINTNNPDASSALEIESTTGGILIPRLKQTQRDAITEPATGLMIYQTDQTSGFYFYDGTAWTKIDGVAGPQGDAGPAGADGAPGAAGIDGTDGVDGAAGVDGTNGTTEAYVNARIAEAVAGLQSQIDDLDTDNSAGSITDQDGNNYDYLTYGDQLWTVENAEMVTYRDGTSIPQVTDDTEWQYLTTGAWSYYDNDSTKPRLYNWYAVMGIHDAASLSDATLRKVFAPEGWHVPSDAEWTTLEEYK